MQRESEVYWVTGASSGIGAAIAEALLRRGDSVALAARSAERLRATLASIGSVPGRALLVPMDVTDDESVRSGLSLVLAEFGRVDVLVNNAGRAGGVHAFVNHDSELLRQLFEVNVFGTERMMRAVLPTMLQRRSGTIVNFASTLGYVPMPGAAAYSAAKAAVVSLSAALRAELEGTGVGVSVFSPPHTSTPSGLTMPLDLPKIFEPAWVAREFLRFLQGKRAQSLPGGNGALIFISRVSPALASRIMNGIGRRALARADAQRELGSGG